MALSSWRNGHSSARSAISGMDLSVNATRVRDTALPLALAVLIYIAWDWGVVAFKVSPMMLPRPAAVFDVVQKNFPLLREHGWSTVRDAASALAISSIVGVAIAFVLSIAAWIRAALMPNLVLLELIPKIA